MSVEKTYFGKPMPVFDNPMVRCPGCKFMVRDVNLKWHIQIACKETYWRQARRYEKENAARAEYRSLADVVMAQADGDEGNGS